MFKILLKIAQNDEKFKFQKVISFKWLDILLFSICSFFCGKSFEKTLLVIP